MQTTRDSYTLAIGGVSIGVRRGRGLARLPLDAERARFVTGDAAADSTVIVEADTLDDRLLGQRLFSATSHGLWELFNDDGQRVIRIGPHRPRTPPTVLARFDPLFREGTVTVNTAVHAAHDGHDPLSWPLDELIVLHLLAQSRGVQLHACGIVLANGRGGIFIGVSGAGKSTLARAWLKCFPGTQILSDDRVIVREREGEFLMYGTPWHGTESLAAPVCVPVHGIYLLRKARENRLTPLTLSSALVARLFACSFVMMYDRAAVEFATTFLTRLAGAVPCHDFADTPDVGAIDCIRHSLEA